MAPAAESSDSTNIRNTSFSELGYGQWVQHLTEYPPLEDVRCIMITGGAGFVGSWAARSMCNTYSGNYEIIVFDKLDYAATTLNLQALESNENFHFFRGDITSEEDVSACLSKYKVDTIWHFAAVTHVDNSFGDPYGFAHANIHGCHVLLECSKKLGVRRFLHMSSYEAYGSTEPGPQGHIESERLSPVNPYAASKACGETLVAAYGRSSEIKTYIIRSQNVYGPNQYPEKIIPKFALLLNQGHKLPLYGSGGNTRRYVYAGDVVNAFNVVMHRGQANEVYNIGSAHEISNKDLCKLLIAEVQPKEGNDLDIWIDPTPDRPFHDRGTSLDCAKLKALGWRQETDLDEGLRRTVEWYKQHGKNWWGHLPQKLIPRKTGANGGD